mgnify:CR=1 FL=1
MNIKQIVKGLEKRRTAVGVERDKLRDLQSEVTDLEETCERAYDALGEAINALSELV